MKVDKNLKQLRDARGFSQAKLAALVGVAEKTVRRWESGETEPGYDDVQKLKQALGVTEDSDLGEPDLERRVERPDDTIHAEAFRIATRYRMNHEQMQRLAEEADDLRGLTGDISAALERKAKRIIDGPGVEKLPAPHEVAAQKARNEANAEADAALEAKGMRKLPQKPTKKR